MYQLGRGNEPVIVVGNMMSLVPRYIFNASQNVERAAQTARVRHHAIAWLITSDNNERSFFDAVGFRHASRINRPWWAEAPDRAA